MEIDARGTYEVYEEQHIANKLGIDKRRVRVESWYWGSEYIIYVDGVFLDYVENFWRIDD